MRKSGELQTKEELMRPQATLAQYTGSIFKQVITWVGSQVRGAPAGVQAETGPSDMLIVKTLLQVRFLLGLDFKLSRLLDRHCITIKHFHVYFFFVI